MSQTIIPDYMTTYIKTNFKNEDFKTIMESASETINVLRLDCSQYSKKQNKYLLNCIFPAIGVYKALQNLGLSTDKSYQFMQKMISANTEKTTKKMWRWLGILPFFFLMFRKMFSVELSKDPWDVEWLNNSADKFEYNIIRCLWHDVFSKHGCTELCKIYCINDNINFTNASKYMSFNRTGTLVDGGTCCDFRFQKQKDSSFISKVKKVISNK